MLSLFGLLLSNCGRDLKLSLFGLFLSKGLLFLSKGLRSLSLGPDLDCDRSFLCYKILSILASYFLLCTDICLDFLLGLLYGLPLPFWPLPI